MVSESVSSHFFMTDKPANRPTDHPTNMSGQREPTLPIIDGHISHKCRKEFFIYDFHLRSTNVEGSGHSECVLDAALRGNWNVYAQVSSVRTPSPPSFIL